MYLFPGLQMFLFLTSYQARSFNVDPDLVRVSVGLEEVPDLQGRFQRALDAVQSTKK